MSRAPAPATPGPGPVPVPPRVPDPEPAWPASAAWPTAPTTAGAELAALEAPALSGSQRRWLARYGQPRTAMHLMLSARMADDTFPLLAHRARGADVEYATLVDYHFDPRSRTARAAEGGRDAGVSGVARAVDRAALAYYLAHAPLPAALPGFALLLQRVPFAHADVRACWARLAPELLPALRVSGTPAHGRAAAYVLCELATHDALPASVLAAIAAVAFDPVLFPHDPVAAETVFDRFRLRVCDPDPGASLLAPEALAPLLAVAPAPWRTRLLTEVVPALAARAPTAASVRGTRASRGRRRGGRP